MKKKTLVVVFFSVASLQLFSQQDAMFSQYMFNQLVINPAYAGNHEVITSNLLIRDQWVGIKGAPKTQTLSVDAPLNNYKVGLGLSVYNDKIGVTNKTGIYLLYAYRIKFKNSILSLGLQGGVSHIKGNYLDVQYSPTNNTDDPAFSYDLNQYTPNFGAGAFYNTDRFYAGFSVPYLLRKSMFQKQNIQGYRQYQHYFLTSGYIFHLNPDVDLKPSILLKYVEGAPLELDVNANFWFYNILTLGASYRTGDSYIAMLELQVTNQLKIGYAYDYAITQIRNYSYGTHELMLHYEFSFKKSRVITPRFF